jgi:hypothetical protein
MRWKRDVTYVEAECIYEFGGKVRRKETTREI